MALASPASATFSHGPARRLLQRMAHLMVVGAALPGSARASLTARVLKLAYGLTGDELALGIALFELEGDEHSAVRHLADYLCDPRPPHLADFWFFQPEYYLQQVAATGRDTASALHHWLKYGASERVVPTREFDETSYLAANADVREAGIGALPTTFITATPSDGKDTPPTPPRTSLSSCEPRRRRRFARAWRRLTKPRTRTRRERSRWLSSRRRFGSRSRTFRRSSRVLVILGSIGEPMSLH